MTKQPKVNPVKTHFDGFSVDEKLMEKGIKYEFIYDGTKMAVELVNEGLKVYSE
jgi:hypothetical protein